ncbi:hypothetical protein [Paenibacillus hexagrammi]|uniref:Uncharacterized protein n=1 Tax=Paenibacillus hexagrammi TaxID=2908839 RepID=A0ABY3SE05_9BACL|nr:hypothetical protein [Paenibacillus sp. YPD9-1]UJF32212.1 hypothetical protein L0M14_21175 [Paenibacillus sp. YPD9-1]
MSPEVAKLKYPSNRRPNLILTDESTSVNLAFNYSETLLDDEDVEDFTKAMGQMLKRSQPAAQWLKEEVVEIHGKPVGYSSFVIPVVDSELYQLIFYVSLEGKALLCTFNCLKDQMKGWERTAEGMMFSLQSIHKKEEAAE